MSDFSYPRFNHQSIILIPHSFHSRICFTKIPLQSESPRNKKRPRKKLLSPEITDKTLTSFTWKASLVQQRHFSRCSSTKHISSSPRPLFLRRWKICYSRPPGRFLCRFFRILGPATSLVMHAKTSSRDGKGNRETESARVLFFIQSLPMPRQE